MRGGGRGGKGGSVSQGSGGEGGRGGKGGSLIVIPSNDNSSSNLPLILVTSMGHHPDGFVSTPGCQQLTQLYFKTILSMHLFL